MCQLYCTYIFPWSKYKEKDGAKDIVHVEFQTCNLPTSYLRLAKVLPGGMKFATCMAAPKWFFEEGYLRTVMGADWSEDHARVQSCNEMVIQPIRMRTSGLERWVMGEAQVLNLPFKCIEGDVVPHWGNWRTAGVEDITVTDDMGDQEVHMQYQRTMSFRLVSVHDNRERLGGQQATVFGYAFGEEPQRFSVSMLLQMVDCCIQIVYHRFIALSSLHYYLTTLVLLDNNMNGPVPSTSI